LTSIALLSPMSPKIPTTYVDAPTSATSTVGVG
jgi:hypothetical protein